MIGRLESALPCRIVPIVILRVVATLVVAVPISVVERRVAVNLTAVRIIDAVIRGLRPRWIARVRTRNRGSAAVNHTGPGIARRDTLCVAAIHRSRLLPRRPSLVPHPTLTRTRHLSRRNALRVPPSLRQRGGCEASETRQRQHEIARHC